MVLISVVKEREIMVRLCISKRCYDLNLRHKIWLHAIAHPLSTNTKYAIDMLDWFEER